MISSSRRIRQPTLHLQQTIRADDERVAGMDDGGRIGLLDDRRPGEGEPGAERLPAVDRRLDVAPTAKRDRTPGDRLRRAAAGTGTVAARSVGPMALTRRLTNSTGSPSSEKP